MNIKIEQNILNSALSILSKLVLSKNSIHILNSIYMEAKNNEIILIGSDSINYMKIKIEGEILEEGRLAIPSKIFIDLIRKLNSQTIILNAKDNVLNINVNEKNINNNIICMNVDEYPIMQEETAQNSFVMDTDLFKEMIRHTIFAVSKDENRKILQGVKMEIEDGVFSMVALDLYRFACIKRKIDFTGKIDAIVPSSSLNEVMKIIANNEEVKISFDDKNIIFDYKHIHLVTRLIYGEYLNYKKAIPQKFNSISRVKTEDLRQSVDRVSIFSRNMDNNSVIIYTDNHKLNVLANNENGDATEVIDNKLEGDSIKIAFNPNYILEGLKEIDCEEIEFKMIDSFNPCIISPNNDPDYIYMIVPMRLPS